MAYIGNDLQVAFPSYRIIDDISGGFNGTQKTFALTVGGATPVPFPINPQQCLLSVNGVIQKPDPTGASGFNLVGSNIVFASAPTGGWSFFGVILAGADYVNVGANFPSGSAAAPSITFDSDTDTGIYNSGANQVSITTAGVERFRVDSAGQIEAVSLGSAASPTFSFTTDTNTGIYSPGADQLAISTNGTGRLFVDASGNIGVGTSAPQYLLDVSGSSPRIRVVDPSTGFALNHYQNTSGDFFVGIDTSTGSAFGGSIAYQRALYSSGAYPLSIFTNGARALTIDSSQRVGIGTTSPGARLVVTDTASLVAVFSRTGSAGSQIALSDSISSVGIACSSGALTFGANGYETERARIDSSGRLLVGTSSARTNFFNASVTSQLQVEGTTTTTSSISCVSNNASGNNAGIFLAKSNGAAVGSNTIVSNGDVLGGVYIQGSDGSEFVAAAQITAEVDGTPGTNDMPGRIVFATTADGASSPTERLRITSAGLVGIGTSAPSSILDIKAGSNGVDTLIVRPNTTSNFITFKPETASNQFNFGYWTGSAWGTAILNAETFAVAGASEKLRITSAGLVGIGTSVPVNTVDVNGSVGVLYDAGLQLYRQTGTVNNKILAHSYSGGDVLTIAPAGNDPSSVIRFQTASGSALGERARIDSSGRLLVGTSTARANFYNGTDTGIFQVEGANDITKRFSSFIYGRDNSDGPLLLLGKHRGTSVGGTTVVASGDEIGRITFQGSDGTQFVAGAEIQAYVDATPGADDMPGRLVFSTTADGASSPTERMRITNTGQTAIRGTTAALYISSGAAAGTTSPLIQGEHSSTAIFSGTTSFLVWTNGNVQNTNNSYGAISDLKLKENIIDASSQWSDIKALQVRKYNFKEGQTHTQIGLIAQEVELVSPGLVSESPDRDGKGNDLGTVTKSVNYSVLYMKAVKALQEAMERIEVLEQRLTDAGIA